MKKKMLLFVFASVLSFSMGIQSYAADHAKTEEQAVVQMETAENETENPTERAVDYTGWWEDEEGTYYYENGEMLTNGVYVIEDVWYMFDEEGYLEINSYDEFYDEESYEWRYYLSGDDGALISGWVEDENGRISFFSYDEYYQYFDSFIEEEDALYYIDEDGYLLTSGEVYDNGIVYTADENGVLTEKTVVNGWIKDKGYWYYCVKGEMITDQIYTVGNKDYCFASDGKMMTGAFEYWDENTQEYRIGFAEKDGHLVYKKSAWHLSDGEWYYFKEDGNLACEELIKIDNKKYCFDSECTKMTGCAQLYNWEEGRWCCYLTDDNGAVREGTGWKYDGLYYYYTNAQGECYTDCWIQSHYYVDSNGKMVVGEYEVDGQNYYFDSNGYCRNNINEKFTGWKLIGGQWYHHNKNGEAHTGWVDGQYYVVDGRMETNRYIEWNNAMYYLRYDGKYIRNTWQKVEDYMGMDSSWIYADENGKLVKEGWKCIGGRYYYFDWYNILTGVQEINGKTEIFAKNGVWKSTAKAYTGWKFIDGEWYYFYGNGSMLCNTYSAVIDGKTYYFAEDGRMLRNRIIYDSEYGMIDSEDGIRYIDASGYVHAFTGWKKVQDKWYYADANGNAVHGLKYINGSYYYLYYGEMLTGNRYVEEWDRYAYFNKSGAYQSTVQDGWIFDGEEWYYFKDGKACIFESRIIGGKVYYFGYNGMMASGPHDVFLFSSSGALLKNAWYESPVTGKRYYADGYGRIVTGQQKIGNRTYWFDLNGILVK